MRGEQHGYSLVNGKPRPEYAAWNSMKNRCLNPRSHNYDKYGARGIKIHQEWIDSFQAFIDHMGPRPVGHSLDRIDNNGNYEPGNVRWADIATQNRNQRRTIQVEIEGDIKVFKDWARQLCVSYETCQSRVSIQGMSYQDALLKDYGLSYDRNGIRIILYQRQN